jgi:hypothetical protein
MVTFEVFGPFSIPFEISRRGRGGRPKKIISKKTASEFWKEIAASVGHAHLASKKGCYVFAMSAGRGSMPWYVGKAEKNQRTLKHEVFHEDKRRKYNGVLKKSRRRTPHMFLLVRTQQQGRLGEAVDELETLLVWMAAHRNGHLINKKKRGTHPAKLVRISRQLAIKNLVNASRGQPNESARRFELLMKIRER